MGLVDILMVHSSIGRVLALQASGEGSIPSWTKSEAVMEAIIGIWIGVGIIIMCVGVSLLEN